MSDAITFVMNGELVSITHCHPTRTILQYLREDMRLTGSKEGCAEGDCGACTVVITDLDENGQTLRFKAINACIAFLPTLHGKGLLTVEALSQPAGSIHPVQQAMVDMHASQCGFCTPGFVMSLFAQYQSGKRLNDKDIDEVLSGNLCRCTGYRPIRDAALAMYDYPATDSPLLESTRRKLIELQSSTIKQTSLTLQTADGNFFAPTSTEELSTKLLELPDAQLLAGGTDIGLWVTKAYKQLGDIIYLGNVPGLKTIELKDTELVLGAAVTWSEAMLHITALYPAFTELFIRFASVPIRNAATIGGNIANASPIGDSMPALITTGASLLLRRGSNTRTIALDEFYLDYQQTLLADGEFVEKIIIPRPEPNQTVAAYKISKRFDQDISAICGCFSIELNPLTQTVKSAKIAFGGMAAIPKRATMVEAQLTSKPWNEQTINQAVQAFGSDFAPINDVRASADYRLRVAENLLRRFFLATTQPAELINVYQYER